MVYNKISCFEKEAHMSKLKDWQKTMTSEEKVAMTSGQDYWRTKPIEKLDIPKITLSDGPHGLRHQGEEQDHMGINESNRSTCFPPACLTAASFDPSLLEEMGEAIGYEALCEDVQVVLGPGVNLKRNPLCGRNFEYFSEDPVLAGHLATGFIKGVKSMGVGVSIKHFALNNQENSRMVSNSMVDKKTMFDLYLKAFEIPIREAKPDTVMCSYNLVNGIYASENPWLLTEVLREKFGFRGLVVTDWGAMNNKIKSLKAGLDLEMPGGHGYFDAMTLRALQAGTLKDDILDQACQRIIELVEKTSSQRDQMIKDRGSCIMTQDKIDEHHELARRIATESAVLLKNDQDILPLDPLGEAKIHLIGELARKPRYQGAGSSHINAYRVTSFSEIMEKEKMNFNFISGYDLSDSETDINLDDLSAIQKDDQVILALGLPESYEAEGFDRKSMNLPKNQNRLVEKVLEKTKNVVVVLYGGAPVEMPWANKVPGVLDLYLPGQAGGEAAWDLVFGRVNPSGKLPETYAYVYDDYVNSEIYGKQTKQVEYREGLYVGYRYFDRAKKPVLFPFGHGLSYTKFLYTDLQVNDKTVDFKENETLSLSFKLKNIGHREGKEVVQLYLREKNLKGYGVEKRLLAFNKIELKAGEEKDVSFVLRSKDFEEYDSSKEKMIIKEGEYEVLIGSSSKNLILQEDITIKGEVLKLENYAPFYENLEGKPTRADFITLLGLRIDTPKEKKQFTVNDTLSDMKDKPQMKPILKQLEKILKSTTGTGDSDEEGFQTVYAMLMETPIKRLSLISPEQMPKFLGETLVHVANGHYGKGVKETVKGLGKKMRVKLRPYNR